jgi:hypothetical protein
MSGDKSGTNNWRKCDEICSGKGFAEGELSQPSDKFVGGKSTMEKSVYFGPGTPPNTDWHHYTWTLVATDLDPKALQPAVSMTTADGAGTPAAMVVSPNSDWTPDMRSSCAPPMRKCSPA